MFTDGWGVMAERAFKRTATVSVLSVLVFFLAEAFVAAGGAYGAAFFSRLARRTLWLLAGVASAAFLSHALTRRAAPARGAEQPAPLSELALAAVALVPGVVQRLPALIPLLFVVLPAYAVTLALFRLPELFDFGGRTRATSRGPFPLAAAVAAFLVYAAVGLHYLRVKGWHSGDEIHYLLQTISLLKDGDLDLRNQIEARCGRFEVSPAFYHRLHLSPFSRAGRAYSWHSYGLPLLLAPGYALAGETGATLSLALLAAFSVYQLLALLRDMGFRPSVGLSAGALLSLTPRF